MDLLLLNIYICDLFFQNNAGTMFKWSKNDNLKSELEKYNLLTTSNSEQLDLSKNWFLSENRTKRLKVYILRLN